MRDFPKQDTYFTFTGAISVSNLICPEMLCLIMSYANFTRKHQVLLNFNTTVWSLGSLIQFWVLLFTKKFLSITQRIKYCFFHQTILQMSLIWQTLPQRIWKHRPHLQQQPASHLPLLIYSHFLIFILTS